MSGKCERCGHEKMLILTPAGGEQYHLCLGCRAKVVQGARGLIR
jgi:hypothetical protein